jgi:IS4 transposase
LIYIEETEKQLEKRKQELLEDRKKRAQEIRAQGQLQFDITQYHRAHTRSVVLSNGDSMVNIAQRISTMTLRRVTVFLINFLYRLFVG